jgi:hypothetical protein
MGDGALGMGDWAQSPIPQSPIPNPQSPIILFYLFINNYLKILKYNLIILKILIRSFLKIYHSFKFKNK